jgi:DNA-binding MarR family transcriptional regulator
MNSERELDILEAIHNRRHIKQRDLAHILGISVGMTNAIIRRLAQKGFLTIRKVNNRNIRYAVSPDGMEALAKRSVRYLKSTIRNVVDSKQAVEELVVAVKRLGYDELHLVGSSALDFVVEHLCGKYSLEYRQLKTLPPEGTPAPAPDGHTSAGALNAPAESDTSAPDGHTAASNRPAESNTPAESDTRADTATPPTDDSPPVAGGAQHAYFLFSENFEEPSEHNRESHGYLRTILSSKATSAEPADQDDRGALFAGHGASVQSPAGINR